MISMRLFLFQQDALYSVSSQSVTSQSKIRPKDDVVTIRKAGGKRSCQDCSRWRLSQYKLGERWSTQGGDIRASGSIDGWADG